MADHLHPAIDIPGGGLWEGACVRRDGSAFGVVIDDDSVEGDVLCALTHASSDRLRLYWIDVTDLSLRLDDPLGLGLAGLAARVAERCGYEWSPADGIDDLAEMLADERWAPVPWRYWYEDGLSVQVIREAATLLARLDRLAAAVDPKYTVRSGVVPEWDRVDPWPDAPEQVNPHAGWRLTLHEAGRQHPRVTIWHDDVLGLDTPDPLAALGAALEVCGA